MRTVSTENAPVAIGPYSQGTSMCNLVFTSMQIPLDPVSGELIGTTAPEQAKQCLANLKAIVEAGGGSMNSILKTMVYLTDISQFAAVNEVYAENFSGKLPARGVIEVSALPKGALVAMECIACLEK
jgi:2-iminobutanoate/2-iminopropanoate deaminase